MAAADSSIFHGMTRLPPPNTFFNVGISFGVEVDVFPHPSRQTAPSHDWTTRSE
jgi:hypothetical protein